MQDCRIDGNVVSSHCHSTLKGWRILICQPLDASGAETGSPLLAVDRHGAGRGERVIVTTDGSTTRSLIGDDHSPVRNMVIGIIND